MISAVEVASFFGLSVCVVERLEEQQMERLAYLGDTILNHAVVKFLLEQFPHASLETLDKMKQRYVANRSMFVFMQAHELCDNGSNHHGIGTRFEALVALGIRPEQEFAFAERWIKWVDDHVMPQEEVVPVHPSGVGQIVRVKIPDDALVHIEEQLGGDISLLSCFQSFKDQAISLTQMRLLGYLDQLCGCKRCDQHRFIIFRCSVRLLCRGCISECGGLFRICYSCGYTINLEDKTEKNNVVPYFVLQKAPVVQNLILMQGETIVGLPLCCTQCGALCGVVNHCSNKYSCRRHECSRKYPCKQFTSWLCLDCGAVRRLTR